MANTLLLSAYDAASHKRWRQELEQYLPQHCWTQLALPPRYFSWRIRGNSLSWAFSRRHLLEQPYDLIIATSMVDLSALRGFIPSLAAVPTLLYFHENQFAYPANDSQTASVEPQIIQLYSALCADQLAFNSDFNRATFLEGTADLLRRLPDHVPEGILSQLRSKSVVLPVPLAERQFTRPLNKSPQFTLVWNHRWEYDKGPERLLAMLQIFFANWQATEAPFTLHVVGQQFRQQPAAFAQIQTLLSARSALGQWGYCASAEAYQQLLNESHLVLSTALHDFQGLAILEAVAAGCVPLVPARQAYPEWFDAYCYPSDLAAPENEARAMAAQLQALVQQFQGGRLPRAPDIEYLGWPAVGGSYSRLLDSLIG